MSDIGNIFPWPVALVLVGTIYWPVTLALGFITLFAAIMLRGVGRWACAAVSVLFIADAALALLLSAN